LFINNQEIKNFEQWNEYFIKKYDIDDYYEKSNFAVRFIEKERIKTVIKFINFLKQIFIKLKIFSFLVSSSSICR